MLKHLIKLADKLISLSAFIGSVALVVEVVIILADVIGRAFDAPLEGAHDISQMSMLVLVFGAMAVCDRSGGHIAVDVFEQAFSKRLNESIDIFSAFLGSAIFLCIAWATYESSIISQMLNLATNILYLPKVYFQWIVCGFAIITSLAMFMRGLGLAVYGKNQNMNEEAKL